MEYIKREWDEEKKFDPERESVFQSFWKNLNTYVSYLASTHYTITKEGKTRRITKKNLEEYFTHSDDSKVYLQNTPESKGRLFYLMSFWAIRDLDRKSYLSYIKPEWLSFHSGMDIIHKDFDFREFVKSRKQARTMFFRIFRETEEEHDASFVSAREVLFDLVGQIADTINDEEGYENLLYYIRHPRDERVKEDTSYNDLFSVIFGEGEVTPSMSFLDHFLIGFIEDDGYFLSGKDNIYHALFPDIPSTKSLFRGPKEFFSQFCQYLYQNHCSLFRLSRLWYLACYDDFYLTESTGKDIRQTKNFCRFLSYRREAIHRRPEVLSSKGLSNQGSLILFFNPSEIEEDLCYAYQTEIARRLGGYLLPEKREEKNIPSLFPFRMIVK